MSQYRPAAVKQVTVDGKVYGIPEFYSVRVLMINNKAVKEAGLSPSDVDTPPTGPSWPAWPTS
jgi:multiple sugar transport system substrate-binding protein